MKVSLQHLFKSYYLGGFACATPRRAAGERADLAAATGHAQWADADYQRLVEAGVSTAREGVRWHLVEQRPGYYDFSSVTPILHAARKYQVQIVWDLMHFGWPDDVDVFQPSFVTRFAQFAGAFAHFVKEHFDEPLHICPINEASFLSWMGGESGAIHPFAQGRGFELKCQLVRATIAATEAVWDRDPRARMHQVEPVFNVVARPDRPQDAQAAQLYRQLQFQTWDLLAGRSEAHLGGAEEYLDVIGLSYYPWSQWYYDGPLGATARLDEQAAGYLPFVDMIGEVWQRYQRPLYVAETGCEGERRAAWLSQISNDVREALSRGIPVEGICWYPMLDCAGWDGQGDRPNGLWAAADEVGERELYLPLGEQLEKQSALMHSFLNTVALPANPLPHVSAAA